jgi:hypothetical protein
LPTRTCLGSKKRRSFEPPLVAPFGAAETGRRDGRGTQEAHARLHSGGSLNRSHACAAGGGGSFAAPTGHALSLAVREAYKEALCVHVEKATAS